MNNNTNVSLSPNGSTLDGVNLNDIVIPSIIELILYLLTVLLAFAYTGLITIRPAFRRNKLNWFIVNICLQSAVFSLVIQPLIIEQVFNISSALPCRLQGYLIIMAVCQMLYSHCVASVCRLLSVVYANKHLFRSSAFTWICMATGWLVSFSLATPYIFVSMASDARVTIKGGFSPIIPLLRV